MQISRASLLSAILVSACAWHATAQILAPAEVTDPEMSALQQSHLAELHAITAALNGHQYPYRFYFSRKLDLTEREQQSSDQRAIQFDRFRGQVVLKVTGNYFAAYSAERMSKEERARQTFEDVMLPILQAAQPALAGANVPEAFALEISHHVIRKTLGVDTEGKENVVLILPSAAARRLVEARDEAGRIAAVLEGSAYLNAVPISFWPAAARPAPTVQVSSLRNVPAPVNAPAAPSLLPAPPVPAAPMQAPPEAEYRDTIARMLRDLDAQAHFVPYAPPSFIPFRGGQYLQIPITTPLAAADLGSQYRLAALAFDRHIAHLIRPVVACFKDKGDFTGIDFSTSVRIGWKAEAEVSESVEFILPLSALRSYVEFDLTGQQLINAGVVLINGERVGLDLQTAEAFVRPAE